MAVTMEWKTYWLKHVYATFFLLYLRHNVLVMCFIISLIAGNSVVFTLQTGNLQKSVREREEKRKEVRKMDSLVNGWMNRWMDVLLLYKNHYKKSGWSNLFSEILKFRDV
ncbi:hypothetical protein ATANTOWER_016933 [Ataeniobius toweri]|uniref:ATP synthase F0 subunit 8 n=1 Tax=Ataeniobius toweri TaxID=208326 RepID=A0ABU7CAA1_9TELE|nr:hypothetical protein [Ataeniobius toweri]